jgi:CheY-like chemotaxis protein
MDTEGIIEVGDVETLIRSLADVSPDLLFLDWRLYGSPAPETCRLLQKAYPSLKIVLISVNADDESAAREAGADFIYKGASPDELIATLTPLLREGSHTNDPDAEAGSDLTQKIVELERKNKMQTNRSNIGALIGGTILIAFGLLSLAGQFFRNINWGFLWPFIVIAIGATFFAVMFTGGKQTAPFAIPGSIISGIGLVLLFQNLTRHWESMSYFWTLIIMFVGVGIYIMGWYGGDEGQKQTGMRLMKVGVIMFIIFGAFFEMIFSSFGNMFFPILLIALGAYLVLTRSGLIGRKKDDSSVDSVPPAS